MLFFLKNLKLEVIYFIVQASDIYVRFKRFYAKSLAIKSSNLVDQLTSDYCNFSRKSLPSVTSTKSNQILIDCFPIPIWVAANGVLSSCLALKNDAEIFSFGETSRDIYTDKLYKSFHCDRHLVVKIPKRSRKRFKKLFLDAIQSINSNQELFFWSIDGVQIGDEVYETYLRMFNMPTVDVKGIKCRFTIFSALKYYLFFEDYFLKNNITASVLSHDIYISTGVLAKICWSKGIPVYLSSGVELKKTSYPNHKYSEFTRYRKYFQSISRGEQSAGLEWAKNQLNKRLGGIVGVNMSYSNKSAFVNKPLENQITPSEKIKIVIATHCFFDNPRAYGGMLFNDFYEWICYLGVISNSTDYDWYIKCHPDFLPGTLEALNEIVTKYPKLRIINPETSWHQLRHEGVSVVLTCYGSVGHELPLLGFKVINSGYNPHVAYRFNWHAKNLLDYENLLRNIENLGEICELESLYEFYYVHYSLSKRGGWLFSSYDEMVDYLKTPGVHSNKIFERVLMGGDGMSCRAKNSINEFLESGAFSEVEFLLGIK